MGPMTASRTDWAWRVVAIALAYEVVNSASWISRILSFAAAYDATVFAVVGVRAAVTALQVSAVLQLWAGRSVARVLGPVALMGSAILLVFEIGLRLAPSSLPPGQRGVVVAAYAVYAVCATWLLRRSNADG